MAEEKESVLFVDDEPYLLSAIKRQLGRVFNITTAESGQEAIRIMSAGERFPVVVSDMRMPGMDGIRFLGVVKQRFPESVRVMLTGNADLDTAVGAVNEGNIFRFLQKPCPSEKLEEVVFAALTQYRLQNAEREILEKTVNGSISVLVDLLSLANPLAFSRAKRIKYYVQQILQILNLPNRWQFEIAAQLSQIGFVAIPSSTLQKIYDNEKLSSAEKDMIKSYPRLGYELLSKIPKLESAAEMIIRHQNNFNHDNKEIPVIDRDQIEVGGEVLKAASHFDTFLLVSGSKPEALHRMSKNSGAYNPQIIKILEDIDIGDVKLKVVSIKIEDLKEGSEIASEIITKDEVLLAAKGQEVTSALKVMLINYAKQGAIDEHVMVSNI